MKYVLLLFSSVLLMHCSSAPKEQEESTTPSEAKPYTPPSFEGRHAPKLAPSNARFSIAEESELEYNLAVKNQKQYPFLDQKSYKNMVQDTALCWDIPMDNHQVKHHCPGDEEQYKFAYLGRWEDRNALAFEVGIPGFHSFTEIVELETGWSVQLEGYLHISPGSRWVVGIANEPISWVGMYIYDAKSLNYDRVYEVGEANGGYADAFHSFDVQSPIWVSDNELHLYEVDIHDKSKHYYVLHIDES